jgi:hypothetical protein
MNICQGSTCFRVPFIITHHIWKDLIRSLLYLSKLWRKNISTLVGRSKNRETQSKRETERGMFVMCPTAFDRTNSHPPSYLKGFPSSCNDFIWFPKDQILYYFLWNKQHTYDIERFPLLCTIILLYKRKAIRFPIKQTLGIWFSYKTNTIHMLSDTFLYLQLFFFQPVYKNKQLIVM